MRNLKRVLALALALVMVIGMMVMGTSAASYTDAESITADYVEAIDVMSGVGMFEGTDGEFNPDEVLTRAQAAALLARLNLGKKTADKLVATKQIFTDVAASDWEAGEVEYCYTVGLIDGLGDGTFNPDGELTGIAFAKLLLVAMGYDADAEGYVGKDWAANIAVDARNAGLMVDGVVLADAVTREVAAQMLFQALEQNVVAYETYFDKATGAPVLAGPYAVEGTAAKDYDITGTTTDDTLQFVEKYFSGLKLTAGYDDDWGRPADHAWEQGVNVYANIMKTPVATYTEATSECDIAKDLGLKAKDVTAPVVLNGDAAGIQNIRRNFDPRYTVGAQGRLTEIYNIGNPANPIYKIVMIDQFLAKVLDVTEIEYDKNGHVAVPATLTLKIYEEAQPITLKSSIKNFTEYTPFATVLVYFDDDATPVVEYVADAESMVGAQTSFTTKASHIVEGTEYPDAVQFNHDEAVDYITDYTWYFDTYGNLIGSFEIATKYSYGVISAIKWVEMDDQLAKGYALGLVTYMDGTQETVKIFEIDGTKLTALNVDETLQDNTKWVHKALYKIESTKLGLVMNKTASTTATIETGVPKMATGLHAGNATQYLVWNQYTAEYETYTGIKNVPSYEEATIWYADTTKPFADGVVEYVFVIADEVSTSKSVTYFWNTNLTVETVLNPVYGGAYYYVVSGGYVNGVKDVIYIPAGSEDVLTKIVNRATGSDVLFVLDTVNGYTVAANAVEGGNDVFVPSLQSYVTYAGSLKDAVMAQDVLVINGVSFDIENVSEITYKYDLEKTYNYYADEAYVYIVYTKNPVKVTEKIASLIYITDIPGTQAPEAPEAPNYDEAVNAGVEALVAAKAATTIEEKRALVNGDLMEAYALLAPHRNTGDAEKDAVVDNLYAALAEYSELFKTEVAEYDAEQAELLTARNTAVEEIKDAFKAEGLTDADLADDTHEVNNGATMADILTSWENHIRNVLTTPAEVENWVNNTAMIKVAGYATTYKTAKAAYAANNVSVSNGAGLVSALASDTVDSTITMTADATVAASALTLNGGVIDGGNKTLTVTGAVTEDGEEYGIYTTVGGTIKNLTISGASRGVYAVGTLTSDLVLENVTIVDSARVNVTGPSTGTPTKKLVVTDSTLAGWISFSETAVDKAVFTDCTFVCQTAPKRGNGVNPYASVEFDGCSFAYGFTLDLSDLKSGETVTLKNCYVDGVLVTDANVQALLGAAASSVTITNT